MQLARPRSDKILKADGEWELSDADAIRIECIELGPSIERRAAAGGRSLGLYLLFAYGLGVAGLAFVACAYVVGAPELPAVARRIPLIGSRISAIIAPRYRRTTG